MAYDETVDMWSLGCIIFNMVMGVPPFYENDETKLINLVQHGEYKNMFPAFNEQVSDLVSNVLKKLINEKPAQRLRADKMLKSKWISQT